MRLTLITLSVLMLTISPLMVFTQANSGYEVEVLISRSNDTKEVDSVIDFSENTFTIKSDKKGKYNRQITYQSLKRVQYSYTKYPTFQEDMSDWKKGLIAFLAVPVIIEKSRTHWLTIVTDNDFVVLKLERDNHRQICLEFEVHNVKVKTVAKNSAYKEN